MSRLIPVIELELHRIAQRCMAGERVGHSLQATALVNEAYIRLIDVRQMDWQNRAHFLAMPARLMRRILVDSARAKRYQKRGGGNVRITFDEGLAVAGDAPLDLVALDDALHLLAKMDERRSQIIELRFFGGLTVEERRRRPRWSAARAASRCAWSAWRSGVSDGRCTERRRPALSSAHGPQATLRKNLHEIFADFGLPGRTIESITFTRHGRSDSARITFAADEACPALTRTMVIGLWRARTKYEVLRELVDTGFTHHHCGAIIARACAADFAARGLCF